MVAVYYLYDAPALLSVLRPSVYNSCAGYEPEFDGACGCYNNIDIYILFGTFGNGLCCTDSCRICRRTRAYKCLSRNYACFGIGGALLGIFSYAGTKERIIVSKDYSPKVPFSKESEQVSRISTSGRAQ